MEILDSLELLCWEEGQEEDYHKMDHSTVVTPCGNDGNLNLLELGGSL